MYDEKRIPKLPVSQLSRKPVLPTIEEDHSTVPTDNEEAKSFEEVLEKVEAHSDAPVVQGLENVPEAGPEAAVEALVSEAGTPKSVEDEEIHDDKYYGNAWEIIQYAGVAKTTVWAVLSAAVSGLAGYFFAPGPSWIMLTVIGFFLGVIAAVDLKTLLIKNTHTLITAAFALPLGVFVASQLGWLNLVGGLITAAAVMGTLLLLVIFVGFGSGGDLKFSPVIGFVLGVINPMVAVLWFFISMVLTMIMIIVFSPKKKVFPFGVGMVMAVPIAVIVTNLLFVAAHLPYMTVS